MSTTEVVRIQGSQQASTEEQQGRLKADLQYLRRKGFFKASSEFSYQGRKCVRCAVPFGRFYNTGAPCIRCRHKVCRQCRIEVRSATDHKEFEWICNVCYKISELSASTDKWIYTGSENGKTSSSPVELLKHSIRRAWTINGPPTRWSASRKSPELCVYRSLPTRQKYRDPINTAETGQEDKIPSLQSVETQYSLTQGVEETEKNVSTTKDVEGKKVTSSETHQAEKSLSRSNSNERTTPKRIEKSTNKQEEEVLVGDTSVQKKSEKQSVSGSRPKTEEQEDTGSNSQEQATPRISLIKPPRILSKFISADVKSSPAKHGERKSNIPIFKRSSKEFEDIRSPQESPKRSLIPQRYRGSTDDLRRSREDISVPSLIPKLLSPRNKEDRLKRYDSKDDIRQASKSTRRDSKEDNKSPSGRDDTKHGLRIFRREDVGRDNLNSNASGGGGGGGFLAGKGKQPAKEEKQDRAEERVGVSSTSKSKLVPSEQDRIKLLSREIKYSVDDGPSGSEDRAQAGEQHEIVKLEVGSREETMPEGVLPIKEAPDDKETVRNIGEHPEHVDKQRDKTYEVDKEEEFGDCVNTEDSMKETSICLLENDEADAANLGVNEKKYCADISPGKKNEDFHVVRRKFSKEEFSNPDDTDDAPNKRCSSHLSPEASPLSTRSSRYSPRESESEPTPALPRKTGDSCSASQRIREAITRTRRESNSSTRYESSGSESVRLSETGLHGYTEIARKVKFFGGSGAVPSVIGSDEVVQRDSATSAGEDETQDDNHCRSGPVASQGRSMLRRRRQFDAQGSRRRGRSHARSCCAEELQAYQAFHVIGRGSRQASPTGNQGQDQPIVDYRRLVFISSDSSSGREEDDADSSCSSSSYLNGLPRTNSAHTQSLEDCDWDYFESGSLPLPTGVPLAIGRNNAARDSGIPQDWSCCPGRGSAACQACGGSRGANVLPVPVPIPVPVPYPVPIPAALWTGDFVAAASSMISRSGDTHAEPGTLRLRGDPAAPWFAWHPRFNQPLHGARLDPRLAGAFDPATCTFRPEQLLTPRLYGTTVEASSISSATDALEQQRLDQLQTSQDEKEHGAAMSTPVETIQERTSLETKPDNQDTPSTQGKMKEENSPKTEEDEEDDSASDSDANEEAVCQDSLVFERRNKRVYEDSSEDSASSSGRSSADTSDLEEDSSTHRFSRVFVVNDDSLTSDNDIEDNGEEDDDSDCAGDGGVTLKRVTALPEESEPVVLQYVRLLDEDGEIDALKVNRAQVTQKNDLQADPNLRSATTRKDDIPDTVPKPVSFANINHNDKRKVREKRNSAERSTNDKRDSPLRNRSEFEELYLASDNDCTENPIQLKSIKILDPDNIGASVSIDSPNETIYFNDSISNQTSAKDLPGRKKVTDYTFAGKANSSEIATWDSNITPDSLEISGEEESNGERQSFDTSKSCTADSSGLSTSSGSQSAKIIPNRDAIRETDYYIRPIDTPVSLSEPVPTDTTHTDDKQEHLPQTNLNLNGNIAMTMGTSSAGDSFTSNDTNTTGSELSSDELHEYEVTPANVSSFYEKHSSVISALNRDLLFQLSTEEDGKDDRRESCAIIPENGTCNEDSVNTSPITEEWNPQCEQEADHSNIEDPSNAHKADPSGVTAQDDEESFRSCGEKSIGMESENAKEDRSVSVVRSAIDSRSAGCDVDMITRRIEEMLLSSASTAKMENAHDGGRRASLGESTAGRQVVGEVCSGECIGGSKGGGGGGGGGVAGSSGGGCAEEGVEGGSTRFRSVERRPSTRKENGFAATASANDSTKDHHQHFPPAANHNSTVAFNSNNKYRSLVMITQEASYQPVSVITSDTTTLLQPDEVHTAGQGLAGYFQLALEAVAEQPHRKNGPRKPLMVKRSATATSNQSEPEVDSGLSVGSASESDDVSVKNAAKINARQENNNEAVTKDRQVSETRESPRTRASPQSSEENSGGVGGVVILEEGLADDDSWVEEVSHDEDEPGATTATEESSEDEANNLGDREEELRGYHRQAIDFTLHTIVEESCEESEAEPSLAAGSPSKKQRPPSASELEKYFFFGLGGEGNNSSMGSREVDSLSETSSIYSEGLESLGQDENSSSGQNPERSNSGDSFLNSSRLEKYFLSEFLGFDQDRRDSDGSVGSDSEGRPSPEAQRRKRLVRARGTGRSHSSSLDNLLALTQSSQNLSSQNSLQDLSLNQDSQETLSEGSSTETDVAEEGQTPAFGTDGQFDTVKRKKKKPRNIGTQSPRVPEDRNKTPEPTREMVVVGEVMVENDAEGGSEDSDRAKTPQPESVFTSSSSPLTVSNNSSSSHAESSRNIQMSSGDSSSYNQKSKQQSRDSGFVGSCDDLLQHQKLPEEAQPNTDLNQDMNKDRPRKETEEPIRPQNPVSSEGLAGAQKSHSSKLDHPINHSALPHLPNPSLSRKDSFNNWSSDEETNLMMSKMRQFFKTMVANTNGQGQNTTNTNSTAASPAPSPRLHGYSSKSRISAQNRTKPPQLVYFENELTRLMKTVPGIRDEQVREIVEYLSSEDTWSDSYDSSDYTSSDLEGAAGGRRSALQEQISQSCQQIISKFDTTSGDGLLDKEREDKTGPAGMQPPGLGRDTAFVYQKLVQSFTKMTGDGVSSDASSTPHSSPPLIAKVMHHIGSRLVALMHEVSEGGPAATHHSTSWRRYSQHHRTPSSASTTEDDDSTSDSANTPSSAHLQLPRSKSHDPLLLINNHPSASPGQEGEEREASDYERFSWRGSFESALMAADSRTKLSLLACSGDVSGVGASGSASALAMAAKRRSAGDLLFNPKSFSREQLDRVRSCGSIGGGTGCGTGASGGSIEERIWSNRRRSSVPDANTRGESGASAGDEDTEDELEYPGESRATTLPRGMQSAIDAATNSLPRLPASTPAGLTATSGMSSSTMHKAHSVYHFLPQHSGVKSARYRPPGFARNTNVSSAISGPKRAVSAPGLQVSGSQSSASKRDNSRSRRQQAMSLSTDDGSSLSEACSTPIIGTGSRAGSTHNVIDVDDMDSSLHSSHLATRASLSSLGARSDSMASVYSGAGEGRCCRSVVVTGEVEFALQYDYKHLTFEVHVTKCKNLAPVDVKRKRSDPYVKVYLLPDKSKSGKRKTKVKKHTLNPEFNETLKFHMSLSGLETRTLWLTVWHSDMFGRNDFLGEVRMPLENKIFDDPTPKWYPLQERTEPFDDPIAYKGEVIVGLKFVPPDPTQHQEREVGSDARGAAKSRKNWSRGALHVLVKEARNLQTRAKNSGTCDAFCKSYLLPDKGRSGKQKTGVVRRCGGSPVWGHTFIYKDVSLQELAERGLELTVWDHDRIASNEFLGGVRFNLGTSKHYGKPVDWMDATGRELSLWQNMLERPNFWVEGAVTLRPNLHNHGKNNSS